MKTIIEEYGHLWPTAKDKLAILFKDIFVLHYPLDQEALAKCQVQLRDRVIVVSEKSSITSMLQILEAGYAQIVQKNRADFARELLISAILIQRPQAFFEDAMGILLATTQSDGPKIEGKDYSVVFNSSKQKNQIIQGFSDFLRAENHLMALRDLAVQVAEELLMNAQFSAPVEPGTLKKMYQNADRSLAVSYPQGKQGKFYACYSHERLVIACIDPFGSVTRAQLTEHFKKLFSNQLSEVKTASTGGAGIGLKYILENSGVFYALIKKNAYSCIACAFYLRGMKNNMSPEKHIHLIES
ncbi:MAG: hypothetical protein IT287_07665 [Bdellovibrionaceae bacterium]|nr:hypothetical protein [Pseudobdellovibrionaceae bacterium]